MICRTACSAFLVCFVLLMLLCILLLSPSLHAPAALEASGGYTHITPNQGVDGYNVGAGAWFTNRVSLAADYDSARDTSKLGVCQITLTGLVTSKSHPRAQLHQPMPMPKQLP